MPSGARANRDLSLLLHRCSSGDVDAEQEVFAQTYDELRKIARQVFFSGRNTGPLQPTALVHEAFLKMPRAGEIDWKGRQHFFAIAARAMRRALIDNLRSEQADKRIHPGRTVPLSEEHDSVEMSTIEDVLLIDSALTAFERADARRAKVVEMKVFAGMTVEEIAPVVGKSAEATKKDWQIAKLWLYRWLTER